MSAAFKCDLCDTLQEGTPDQSLKVSPKHGGSSEKQLCSVCLASFNDWMVSRAPEHDRPSERYA
jgi:hypothetical protein